MDSFSAIVQQVVILKEGIPKQMNTYKRKNVLNGPYKPKLFRSTLALLAQTEKPSFAVHTNAVASLSTINPSITNGQAILDFTAQQSDWHNSVPTDDETANKPAVNTTVISTEQLGMKGKEKATTACLKKRNAL